jgi:hypothetical protein
MKAKNGGSSRPAATGNETTTFSIPNANLHRAPGSSATPMRVPRDAQEAKLDAEKTSNRTP